MSGGTMSTIDWSRLTPLELIHHFGINGEEAERLAAIVRTTIVARVRRTDQASIPLGVSRFGGDPDLPTGTPWPTNTGRPLTHVAQLHLPDLVPFDNKNVFPKTGWLCFWVLVGDPQENKKDEAVFKVHYIDNDSDLHRMSPPEENCMRLEPCATEFGSHFALPEPTWDFLQQFDLDADRWNDYGDLKNEMRALPFQPLPVLPERPWWKRLLRPRRFGLHYLLGYPERAHIPAELQDRLLLLQVQSDDDGLGALWTFSEGSLNYLIRPDDLKQLNFEAAEMVFDVGD